VFTATHIKLFGYSPQSQGYPSDMCNFCAPKHAAQCSAPQHYACQYDHFRFSREFAFQPKFEALLHPIPSTPPQAQIGIPTKRKNHQQLESTPGCKSHLTSMIWATEGHKKRQSTSLYVRYMTSASPQDRLKSSLKFSILTKSCPANRDMIQRQVVNNVQLALISAVKVTHVLI
jgi:hypothetical protein